MVSLPATLTTLDFCLDCCMVFNEEEEGQGAVVMKSLILEGARACTALRSLRLTIQDEGDPLHCAQVLSSLDQLRVSTVTELEVHSCGGAAFKQLACTLAAMPVLDQLRIHDDADLFAADQDRFAVALGARTGLRMVQLT